MCHSKLCTKYILLQSIVNFYRRSNKIENKLKEIKPYLFKVIIKQMKTVGITCLPVTLFYMTAKFAFYFKIIKIWYEQIDF